MLEMLEMKYPPGASESDSGALGCSCGITERGDSKFFELMEEL